MKRYISIVLFALCISFNTEAQTVSSGSLPVDPLLKGKDLLGQLAAAFDASTFLNSWTSQDRAQWKQELTNASDAVALSRCASELSEYIKPIKFKEQFSVAQLKGMASATKNYGDVANVLSTLEAGLKSDAFVNDWVSKESSWISELKFVK